MDDADEVVPDDDVDADEDVLPAAEEKELLGGSNKCALSVAE